MKATRPRCPESPQVYEAVSPEYRQKLDALLSLKLSEVSRRNRPLEEIMDEISDTAQGRGMAPDLLQEILGD